MATQEERTDTGGYATADVIVPVLNERDMLPDFIERIAALGLPLNLIFVDNGSSDGTLEYLRGIPGVKLIAHGENLGYGRSLVDGMMAATSDCLVIIDADCEYPPEAIPRLLAALASGSTVVYGSRFQAGGPPGMSLVRAGGNRFLTGLFNLLYQQRLTDLYTGMKGLRREALEGLRFRRDGFEHVAELAARLSRRGYAIDEIPVEYSPRRTGRSKMRHVPELLKAFACLAYFRVAGHA